MGFGSWLPRWGSGGKKVADHAFFEKAYRRAPLAEWDDRWHALSPEARLAYLDHVKGPVRGQGPKPVQPSVSADKFPPGVLPRLLKAGFVRVEPPGKSGGAERVFAVEPSVDFTNRLRGLRRYHLLDPERPSELGKFLDWAYYRMPLEDAVEDVLAAAGMEPSDRRFEYGRASSWDEIENYRWPGWVNQALKMPLGESVLEVIRDAGGPIPVVEVQEHLKKNDPAKVRATLDKLVGYVALVEDIDPKTSDVVVGYLPKVREGLEKARRPKVRPPLEAVAEPKEVGPESGVYVDDLRAVLLEIASDPPQIRQDGALFAREEGRFLAALEPVPGWFAEKLGLKPDVRLGRAIRRGQFLDFIALRTEGKETRLHLTGAGNVWISADLPAQYAKVFEAYKQPRDKGGIPGVLDGMLSIASVDSYSYYHPYAKNDGQFIGSSVAIARKKPRRAYDAYSYVEPKDDDVRDLRESLSSVFLGLKPGEFVTVKSLVDHHTYGRDNALFGGRDPAEVVVAVSGRPVPPLEEDWQEAGQLALDGLMTTRLIPLGCLRAGLDRVGTICVAAAPRLGAYFGKAPLPSAGASGTSASETRVVVQPDFSVVVFGLNPAPVAELAPFCERVTRGAGAGAQTLKITRDSVVRAVGRGLQPDEIVGRLRRLASHEPPANVLHEVREWGGWVRTVKAATLSVIRCPDRDTADRVVAALKGRVERLNETVIALDGDTLAKPERDRLQAQGLLLEGKWEKRSASQGPQVRTRKRRW
jgi:hypothetical protein